MNELAVGDQVVCRIVWRDHVVGQAARFTLVGVLSTALNAVLYVLLRGLFSAGAANVLALALSTAASSVAQRVVVFAGRDEYPVRMHLQTLTVFAFYCVSNNLALGLLSAFVTDPTSVAEAAAVATMSVFGGVTRFVVLRVWVFGRSTLQRASAG
ncbi:hypothetical protein GCM10011581_30530 [Saccharopolyspora subtropica]|uniref:GtrA/DPMS transmembrane domain-containing protein n=1 Tax=Saccharopolyspora thermophila TaxID=89367 RepID=A0A917JYV4_9PSEU|nr:GtrA family protein [Saccharopolyspora subtropica]GGI91343.1 hypothetical protein GCM10011581_30530 [Saccharopolyspora subtropica]